MENKPNPNRISNVPKKPQNRPKRIMDNFKIVHALVPVDDDGLPFDRLFTDINEFLQEHTYDDYQDAYLIISPNSKQMLTPNVFATPSEAEVAIVNECLGKDVTALAELIARTCNIATIESVTGQKLPDELMNEIRFIIKKALASMPIEEYQKCKERFIIEKESSCP